jgi:hypothetical protein
MARPKKTPVLVTPEWRQAVKVEFLTVAFHYAPDAFELLQSDVRQNRMTVRDWADRFDVGGSWVEAWAAKTVSDWDLYPELFPNFHSPSDEKTEADRFSYTVSRESPLTKFALGRTVGGSLSPGAEEDDWERFRSALHRDLDRALDQYREKALREGATREFVIPEDLRVFICRVKP